MYLLTRSISGDLKCLSVINLKRTGNYRQRYCFLLGSRVFELKAKSRRLKAGAFNLKLRYVYHVICRELTTLNLLNLTRLKISTI